MADDAGDFLANSASVSSQQSENKPAHAFSHRTDNAGYGVVIPNFPGCFSAGDTLEEAIAGAPPSLRRLMEADAGRNQEDAGDVGRRRDLGENRHADDRRGRRQERQHQGEGGAR